MATIDSISFDTHTWCLYNRALSLKYRRFWLVDHREHKYERVYATDAAKGTWLATETMIFRLSRLEITLSDCQIAAHHFTEAKYLTESDSKDQRNVSNFAACRMDLWWHSHAITVQAFPAVWLFRGHLVEKNEIFLTFQTLFEQTLDAGEHVLQ